MKLGRILIGLASGLTFGMLFAPKAGKELRKELMKKSGKSGAEAWHALAEAAISAGKEAYEEFAKLSDHEQVKALKSLSKEKLDEFLSAAEDHGFEIAGKVQDKLEEAGTFLSRQAKKTEKQVKEAVRKSSGKTMAKKKKVSAKKK